MPTDIGEEPETCLDVLSQPEDLGYLPEDFIFEENLPQNNIDDEPAETPTSIIEVPVTVPSRAEETTSNTVDPSTTTDPDLDPNILAALGEIVDESPEFGEKIHESLTKIWTPLLKKGMSKESREKMLKEYLIPENCPLLKAPTLNPEIMAAITETGRFRDKKMSSTQQQLGVGIAAINRGLNILLKSDNKAEAIKSITDGCRFLSDLHFQQTETRKRFITPCLDKPFLQLIQVAERDDTLFGNNLSEKIKASKAIVTQSQQIKKNTPVPKPSTSQVTSRVNNQGNWQTPPRFPLNRGGRGGFQRTNLRAPPPPPPAPQTRTQSRPYQLRTRGTTRHPRQQP